MLSVSVIVSTYSEKNLQWVKDCVASLRKQSLPPHEIILVLDPRQDLVNCYRSSFGDIRVIASDGFGLSNARNAGIRSANADVVAFIDDDAVADHDWIRKIVATYEDPKVVGAGGLVSPMWDGGRPLWFPPELDWVVGCSYKGLPEKRESVRNPIGCNMSFRKSVFKVAGHFRTDLGRFGTTLLGSEEPELSLRVLKSFPKSLIIYEPQAIVFHRVSKSRKKLTYLFKRCFYEGVSKALIVPQEKSSTRELSSENQYLTYLLTAAIPSRVKRFFKIQNLSQLIILVFSASAVILGFSIGRLAEDKSHLLSQE